MKKMNKTDLVAAMIASAKALLANDHNNIIEAVEASELFSFEYDCFPASEGRNELTAVMQRIIDETEFVESLIAEEGYEWDTEDRDDHEIGGNYHLFLLAELVRYEVCHPDSRGSSGVFETLEEAENCVKEYLEMTACEATTTDGFGQLWDRAEFTTRYDGRKHGDACVAIDEIWEEFRCGHTEKCSHQLECWYAEFSMSEEEETEEEG